MKQVLLLFKLIFFISFFSLNVKAQNATTGTINIYLLTAPTAHDCPGVIRFEYENCDCLFTVGWNISDGSQPYSLLHCGGIGIFDKQFAPGTHTITATLGGIGCSNIGEVKTFTITVPNPPCTAPNLSVLNTVKPTGYGCNNGSISVIGTPTMCGIFNTQYATNLNNTYYLYNSSGVLLRTETRNVFSYPSGFECTFNNLAEGEYRITATTSPSTNVCDGPLPISEVTVNISQDPVQASTTANLITEPGAGGCLRQKIEVIYGDQFNQTSCAGAGPQTWKANLAGTTLNGKDIDIELIELFGQKITFHNITPGNYTVTGNRILPVPTQGNAPVSISIPGPACGSTLTEISRTSSPTGIGCDSTALIEFEFTSTNCYTTWTLTEASSQLFGFPGTWTANKGQHIFANIPAAYLSTNVYEFVAYSDGDPLLDCPATASITDIPTLGCDGTVRDSLTLPISTPGASDAEVSFMLTTTACVDGPWTVVVKDIQTNQQFFGQALHKNDTIVIAGLHAGNYTYGFEYIGGCTKPDAGAFSLECSTITLYRDNDGDGYGDPNSDTTICSLSLPFLSGYSGNSDDSNDNLKTYPDNDGDGFGFGPYMPFGVPDNTDFNDNCSVCYPGAPELCDGLDNNGDGFVDMINMNGLVLYLPMNGNATDASGNGLNGTINGTVTGVSDRFGNANRAMSFPGNAGSHISIADQTLLRPSSITLAAWVKMNSQPNLTGFIDKSINCYNDSWHFGSLNGDYSTWISNSTNCGDLAQLTSPLSIGNWRHVVFTLDDAADIRKMYVDGVLVASGTYTSTIPYDGNPVIIGAAIENGSLAFPLDGVLDDVMIFNRAITGGEVNTLFINGNPFLPLTTTYYADADGDGFGNPAVSQIACSQPSGYVLNNTDCDDTRIAVNPGAPEICGNGIDDDCNGLTDEAIPVNGLMLFLPFNGNANDASGKLHNGTVFNAVPGADRFGNANSCYVFNGSNSRIEIPNHADLQPANITIACWIKFNGTNGQPFQSFISKAIGSGDRNSFVTYYENNTQSIGTFNCAQSTFTSTTFALPLSSGWIHYATSFDDINDVQKLYINGILVASTPSTISVFYDNNPITIGCESDNGALGFFANASIDEVLLYNRVLTAAEILALKQINTSNVSFTYYADEDGDGFGNPAVSQIACSQPPGYVLNNTDCDDTRNTIYPGATEICDGLDNNCDGTVDLSLPLNGLVAYYPFNGNANDIIGALNGTVYGATLTNDRFGNANSAYSFNGINQSITAPVVSTLTDNFALTGWIRLDALSSGNQILFCNGNSSNSGWGLLIDNAGFLNVIYGLIVLSPTSIQIPVNQWKHVALTRVNGVTKVYVDAVEVFSNAIPSPVTPTNNLTIGINNLGTEYLNGVIDDVKIFNIGLTPAQVLQDYNSFVCTQPITLNLKLFLEGFYTGNETMKTSIYDLGISSNPTETDSVTLNLWPVSGLSNSSPEQSVTTVLHTNGSATVQFPITVNGNSYYIAVKHRNHMETWSKLPVTFTGTTVYDFSDALGKAYDDGVNAPMASVAGGKFAFYGGDVNQDGTVDASDMADVDNDNAVFAFGYNVTDASGDGATDASDISIVDNNQALFLFFARPY